MLLQVECQHAESNVHEVSVGSLECMIEFVLCKDFLNSVLEET